ncbi:thiamine-phosphate pyrophosphorylase [Fictibacillus macauensis ZFHKF-1]|uniref:Thiamine-phosphate synthase n=1 Tax=Fictibacillus macauensis ZFHKF-1 TaxID=1196324 RepID=I8UHD6_9BACL|nr:thiamine phosphate synthase [Fictibacillus macauensis]EIT86325.1 thiamine-phosphate pyrophosphorylase [Fictibacillus macauensis ZFHKF-1]
MECNIAEKLRVYFIAGSNNCLNHEIQEVLEEALKGGATLFQFREKGPGALQGEDKEVLARRLLALCHQYDVPFIVNDDVALMLKINADGLHVGQEDGDLEHIREKTKGKLLGISAHTLEEAKKAVALGADYLGVGPIFPTETKRDAREVMGGNVLEQLRANDLTIPLVAIGGITAENAHIAIRAGADGVSVITAISHADHPQQATRNLVEAVSHSK